MLPPDQIIIRPPIEAYSVLIPITGGCSWNRCRFCGVYKNLQDYKIRKLEEHASMFKEWNDKINLVSRKDIENFEEHHILHSLAFVKRMR